MQIKDSLQKSHSISSIKKPKKMYKIRSQKVLPISIDNTDCTIKRKAQITPFSKGSKWIENLNSKEKKIVHKDIKMRIKSVNKERVNSEYRSLNFNKERKRLKLTDKFKNYLVFSLGKISI